MIEHCSNFSVSLILKFNFLRSENYIILGVSIKSYSLSLSGLEEGVSENGLNTRSQQDEISSHVSLVAELAEVPVDLF